MSLILVVDDEMGIRETFRLIFEIEGYEVMTAANGQEGLRRVSEKRPDLILSDVMMPILDGIEMCEALRRSPLTRDIPIILSSSVFPREGVKKNWDVFMRKPAELNDILKQIKKLLDKQG